VVHLVGPESDAYRRTRFDSLARAQAADVALVEELARRLLRAERERWAEWLTKDARENLAQALNRLDVVRAQLAALNGGTTT
jgi:hypothetical protein